MGLVSGWEYADGFRLATFRNRASMPGGVLHLYLDGDGRPWRSRNQVARNPTPQNALVLGLLARDPAPALYLGRPCYQGEQEAEGCEPWLWTFGRYSERVISAMATALEQLIEAESIDRVTLIGYSGGGVIAWHLAQRIPEVERLVTIAANLDLRAWTRLHGYSPLAGSLDPAAGPPMREPVQQLHLVGRSDQNVPATLTEPLEQRFGPSFQRRLIAAGHADGWLERWPDLLGWVW
ncbi:MAG: alpha/beta hydrolase [Lamprobacter sp.]|uniref:alpha/beta hydrolase n=1 Tax=Lamprobacter sp. TaxID=3100796 RepID=UPI002B263136|nr:alpha/beta fold hydrolase [Lamprobacter sp.]MEA3640548.1 alpha/beta hydrolase [Lamprobacter sp.]